MLTHVIAGLSGFLMKIYDDIVDNPEAYSNIFANKLVLEIVMIACVVYFAHLDSVALIACIATVLVDVIIYAYNLYYPALNINYAIDKPSWSIGFLLIVVLCIYKGSAVFESFTVTDYLIIIAGCSVIFLDAISLISNDKKVIDDPYANMIYLEASDRKLVMRMLAFCGSVAGAIGIQFMSAFMPDLYPYFRVLTYTFTWGIFYFLTSTLSILYLMHQYKQEDVIAAAKKRLTPLKEKIDEEESKEN
jgi:hypothetical protein